MNVIALSGTARTADDSPSASALRRENKVPGVLYGGAKNVHFSVDSLDLRSLIYTPSFNLVDLEVDGQTYRCILKDYQMHPVTDNVEHIDMLALQDGRPLKVDIPVRFSGAAPGLKAGGTLVQKLRKVQVKTTPDKLVNVFDVDISDLELGQSVRVRDMKVAEGVQIMNPEAIPLASIEIPRALKAAEAAAEAEAADGVEGEGVTEGEEASAAE